MLKLPLAIWNWLGEEMNLKRSAFLWGALIIAGGWVYGLTSQAGDERGGSAPSEVLAAPRFDRETKLRVVSMAIVEGYHLLEAGEAESSVAFFLYAKEITREVFDEDPVLMAFVYSGLADAYEASGRMEEERIAREMFSTYFGILTGDHTLAPVR